MRGTPRPRGRPPVCPARRGAPRRTPPPSPRDPSHGCNARSTRGEPGTGAARVPSQTGGRAVDGFRRRARIARAKIAIAPHRYKPPRSGAATRARRTDVNVASGRYRRHNTSHKARRRIRRTSLETARSSGACRPWTCRRSATRTASASARRLQRPDPSRPRPRPDGA